MLNRVILIGRIATDPDAKTTPNGVRVCSFRIAVDRRPNAQGERIADFINVVAWRQQADFVANYLGKGRLIGIDGRLQVRTWTATDGTRRNAAEVVVESIEALDRPKEHAQASAEAPSPASVPQTEPAMNDSEVDYDDPFGGQ